MMFALSVKMFTVDKLLDQHSRVNPRILRAKAGQQARFGHAVAQTAMRIGLTLRLVDSLVTTIQLNNQVSGNIAVNDTDSIPIGDINEDGVVATETITDFGKVYKTAALKQLTITGEFNATQGVAWRLRYSDTAPTGSSDAKSFGTQVEQFDSNNETSWLFFDPPANRYWWFSLSGGGSRTVNKRETRITATYDEDVGDTVAAGTGITITGDSPKTVAVTNPFHR